ncbi:hypothetical protein Back11_52170 [Paenibacillus baekrokdamisoli]|uniref:Uncharacterized protein n=1 Tax=Paenibacillus baekrokdamisoli TaxID=1712516 RepID=A0A3G9IZY9_9BACL|nr:DUF1146 domain-containing protein [Paenibacillus baekrokdamisoli]MBB3069054.1 putative integral membrane protein (TIGR02327 family) [Paenibacillus baekrokdamisoli]BBH23872.1 hypothetical protein Back11_52170 [Paenibacillus baekrokdamisoli]
MDMNHLVATTAGQHALVSIIIELLCITLAWYVLQELKLDLFMRRARSLQARLLQVMLAVVLGHLFAGFVIDYWEWSNLLRGLVE